MWVGGIVGLKAILGLRRRDAALDALRELERLGFFTWSPDPSAKKLSYTLSERNYLFEGSDAWLDLWCHTTAYHSGNAFSIWAPTVPFGKYGAVLTLKIFSRRWGWEKTKL